MVSPHPPGDGAATRLKSQLGPRRYRGRSGVVSGTTVVVVLLSACIATTNPTVVPADSPASTSTAATAGDRYLDPRAPVDERVADLLSRMSLDEKLGQMTLVEKGSISPDQVAEYHIGAVLSGGGGSPRPNTPSAWREMVGAYQAAALSTPLAIPMLYGVDAIHGHNNLRNAVIFPHSVGLGAAGDPELVEAIGRATAIETAATGIRWTYSPVLAVPQDVRWGRTYEAFGENPELVSLLGAAMIRGLQGENLTDDTSVLATAKHFVGDGGTAWGTSTAAGYQIDQGVTLAPEADLRAIHLIPYEAAFGAGALSVMASYSNWENGKVHGDRFLLTEVLRGDLGFGGFVVSDWGAVDQVIPGDYYGSVVQSVNAGIDLVMVPSEFELFLTALRGAVEQGDITQARIDEAVGRILDAKFRMGLFESPMPPVDLINQIGSSQHRELARRAVAKSTVLLKTAPGVLPIDQDSTDTIFLAGTAANDIGIQSGGWTISWQGSPGETTEGTTIYEALTAATKSDIVFDRFGRFDSITAGDGTQLVAPLGIAVVGERPYAEGRGDSGSLSLSDADVDVIRRTQSRVDQLIVVLVTGRPLILGEEFAEVDAIVVTWLPGSEGTGIVDVMIGVQDFGGRLPYTWPNSIESVGRLRSDPCDGARYPVGYGLSTDGLPLSEINACEVDQ